MPLALVVFADKSHLDLHGSLLMLPIIFTLSFFNEKSRNSVNFWRPIAFLPNLNAGSLISWNSYDKKKDPALSVQDEHDCLRGAFSSLRNIHHCGGIMAAVLGKDVVCEPWIHFVVGNNSGNNQFLGHFNGSGNIQQPYHNCKCPYNKMVDPIPQCIYIDIQDYHDHKEQHLMMTTKRDKKKIDSKFSKHSIDNAFMDVDLPLTNAIHGVFCMCPPERLHVTCEGITVYMINCLKNNIGDKGVEKILLNNIEKAHHLLNHQLRRNSERNIPGGSDRNGFLKNTLVNASERRGNLFCLLCLCHTDQFSG
jgi:hypothetical protein